MYVQVAGYNYSKHRPAPLPKAAINTRLIVLCIGPDLSKEPRVGFDEQVEVGALVDGGGHERDTYLPLTFDSILALYILRVLV